MICYLDASALVKRYVIEAGSEDVRQLFRHAELLGTVSVCRTELVAALAKAVRLGHFPREGALAARQLASLEWSSLVRIQVSESLLDQAGRLCWEHGLRGYDAVHLGAAVSWQQILGVETFFATFDRKLWEAAQAEGLSPFPAQLPNR